MTMPRIATIFLSLATVCASNAFAQQINIQPGLWQIDMTLPGAGTDSPMGGLAAQIQRHVASMSPEQRKQMEKAMGDLGASGTEFTNSGMRTKQCLTREGIARFDLLGNKGSDNCTRKSSPMAGGVKVNMVCTRPQMTIDAALKYAGDKAYTFDSTVTATAPDGSTTTQKTSGTGKWLGSECGNVKPLSVNG